MSTTESDSDSSYQSDDSDVNFIPRYVVLEDAEQFLNSSKRYSKLEDNDDEKVPGLAYSEEPLADEEWIKSYQMAENERIEFEEKLCKRFDGSVEISKW